MGDVTVVYKRSAKQPKSGTDVSYELDKSAGDAIHDFKASEGSKPRSVILVTDEAGTVYTQPLNRNVYAPKGSTGGTLTFSIGVETVTLAMTPVAGASLTPVMGLGTEMYTAAIASGDAVTLAIHFTLLGLTKPKAAAAAAAVLAAQSD